MRLTIRLLAPATLALACAWARPAAADCTTDTDCPGPTCGSSVCQWTVSGHQCVPAGTDPQGFDGECMIDVNCKCAPQGATCSTAVSHCTFTVPQGDAAAASTTVDAGGSSTADSNAVSCTIGPTESRGASGLTLAGAFAVLGAIGRRARSRARRDNGGVNRTTPLP